MRWYFYQIGLFEALRAFDQSLYPHIFRYQVFMQRPDYDRNYEKLTESDWLKVKFVRNPFARCVSGYLTLCEIERANRWAEFGDLKKRLESSINRAARERFTFREYVGFLAGYDLDTGDIHIVRQATIAERDGSIGHIHLVHLERRREELLDLERRLGLTDSRAVPLWESGHHTTRRRRDIFVGDCTFDGGQPMQNEPRVILPETDEFYDDALRDTVASLYAADFELYGYRCDSVRDLNPITFSSAQTPT